MPRCLGPGGSTGVCVRRERHMQCNITQDGCCHVWCAWRCSGPGCWWLTKHTQTHTHTHTHTCSSSSLMRWSLDSNSSNALRLRSSCVYAQSHTATKPFRSISFMRSQRRAQHASAVSMGCVCARAPCARVCVCHISPPVAPVVVPLLPL